MPTTINDLISLEDEMEKSRGGIYALNEELAIDEEVLQKILFFYNECFFERIVVHPTQMYILEPVVNALILGPFELGFRLGRKRR